MDQVDDLKEDLLQIIYNDSIIIDVGWYPEFDKKGNFKTFVIKNFDWSNPVIVKNSISIDELIINIEECVEYVKKII